MKLNVFKLSALKFIYNGILTGLPSVTYNAVTKNTLNVPLTVEPYSTYINLKLSEVQSLYMNNYINEYSEELEMIPIPIFPNEIPSNYLSINVYNCSSPAFMNDNKMTTRCEINTYVRNKRSGEHGTMILDYLSNDLSMDPVNIFKKSDNVSFYNTNGIHNIIACSSLRESIALTLNITTLCSFKYAVSDELLRYTDNIFYKNGIKDKVYYDSSLVNANVKTPILHEDFNFEYKDLQFRRADSIFYFTNQIKFIGGMWDNIFDKN